MSEIRAIGDRTTNAELMFDCFALGYMPDLPVFDATYGTGRFWKGLAIPVVGNDLNPDAACEHHHDFRDLPFPDNHWATVVFDPPYKLNGTSTGIGPSALDSGYGVGGQYVTVADKMGLIVEGVAECARICSKYLLVKCQDQVVSGRVVWQTTSISSYLMFGRPELGMELVDMLHVQGYRPQPPGRRQLHARRDYSTLLVFERTVKPEPRLMIGFLGEDHPLPVVHDGELWPDAEEVKGE